MKLIEAGAGSGSFTHASTRAVYNGYPKSSDDSRGKVFSFEFNEARFQEMEKEIQAHGLKDLVHITHRDVYSDGFLINGESPGVECVFLDLPAPWKALPHLSRRRPAGSFLQGGEGKPWVSPLRADRTAHLCTFSPCIEQVTRTVDAMRKLGWMEIDMVEVAHRRINVMRERIGLSMPNDRSTNQTPADVAEAVGRLREVEGRFKEFHGRAQKGPRADTEGDVDMDDTTEVSDSKADGSVQLPSRARTADFSVPAHMSGHLIHRTEPEIKTHTSYLVFAVLPQEWSEEQEAEVYQRWPCGQEKKVIGTLDKETRKQEKRDMLKEKSKKKQKKGESKPDNA